MRWMVILSALFVGSFVVVAHGQLSTDEAMAKLKAKQEARDAQRNKPVTITQGELDDLKAEIARLTVELTHVRAQLNSVASVSSASAAVGQTAGVKMSARIEVGITKDQLMKYVTAHVRQNRVMSDVPAGPNETIVIAQKANREIITGYHSNGVTYVIDSETQFRDDAMLTIMLSNGAVASVDEKKNPVALDEFTPENVTRMQNLGTLPRPNDRSFRGR